MKDRKTLFLLIDGLGDIQRDGLTPLQAVRTPTLDYLAGKGRCGLMDPVEPGLACGSDTAHLSILGFDPRTYYNGRGAFETIGTGLAVEPGDIAFKCVFSHLCTETGTVLCRRADRNFEDEARELSAHLNGTTLTVYGHMYHAAVMYATEHRCGVRIRGPHLTDRITGTDPLKDNRALGKSEPLELTFEAKLTAQVVQAFSDHFHKILEKHRINLERKERGQSLGNVVLFRGPSVLRPMPSFHAVHGLKAFMIAPTCVIAGIGTALQMDVIKIPGATGCRKSDFKAKLIKAMELLKEETYQFGFVHIKAVDEASHSGLFDEKASLLERIDAAVESVMEEAQHMGLLLVVTGDHTTPSVTHYDHTHHPVPFVACLLGDDQYSGDRLVFDEIAVSNGSLGRFTGHSVMNLVRRIVSR